MTGCELIRPFRPNRNGTRYSMKTAGEALHHPTTDMTIAYLQAQIRELATFPGINTAAVLKDMTEAGGNMAKLEVIHDQLLEDTYGDSDY